MLLRACLLLMLPACGWVEREESVLSAAVTAPVMDVTRRVLRPGVETGQGSRN